MSYSADGFVRVPFETLKDTGFSHIISAVEYEQTHAA